MTLAFATIGSPQEEFWYHVSRQDELPLATSRQENTEIALLNSLASRVSNQSKEQLATSLVRLLIEDAKLLDWLRTLISISDKRLYLDLSYRFSRLQSPDHASHSLCGCAPQTLTRHQTSFFINILKNTSKPAKQFAAATAISDYLLEKGLADILEFYISLSPAKRDLIVRNLILPGEIQQVDAKLRGHGIEGALAKVLVEVGASIVPQGKADNPMGAHDPNIDPQTMKIVGRNPENTFSTDLVVVGNDEVPRIFVVGLIHTSDPGQFGVDKSNTVGHIRRMIDHYNSTRTDDKYVYLFGLVDGVGYSENKAGTIEKMIPGFHCMVQNHTLYKAPLFMHKIGLANIKSIAFDPEFYTKSARTYMLTNYVSSGITEVPWDSVIRGTRKVQAGKASLYLPTN